MVASAALTALVGILGFRLADQPLGPDQGAAWYVWQLPDPTVWTRLTAWTGYVAHQLALWALIYYAQSRVRRYASGLHPVNVVALVTNLAFIGLHELQSQLWYDGLAQDVSIFSSQGSVVLLLVVVLLMESRRRGLFFGRRPPIKAEIIAFARRYHGYLFSWAAIYTFWYHPMLHTPGHLVGFFYMFLLLLQGSLFLTRAHTNRWWTLTLEVLVAVHGTLVAVMNSGPDGIWPMFLFGFLAVFVVSQMHGVGLGVRTRWMIGLGFVAAMAGTYAVLGFGRIDEVLRIPVIEYALVGALTLLLWGGLVLASAVRRRRPSLPPLRPRK